MNERLNVRSFVLLSSFLFAIIVAFRDLRGVGHNLVL